MRAIQPSLAPLSFQRSRRPVEHLVLLPWNGLLSSPSTGRSLNTVMAKFRTGTSGFWKLTSMELTSKEFIPTTALKFLISWVLSNHDGNAWVIELDASRQSSPFMTSNQVGFLASFSFLYIKKLLLTSSNTSTFSGCLIDFIVLTL